jgi:regulator of sigma E protease
MLFYLVAFVLLLGPLVFVHELGHFLFAKLFNVRVDVFSMGFGPKIFRKKWGETEYALSAVPLGGYVKLYGQDPSEPVESHLRNRALRNLDAWRRFLVFVAGPLFNFLFAIFVFALMLVVGEPHLSPVIARVIPGSQAQVAGFRSGDTVTAVDRQVITKYDEMMRIVTDSPNKELAFRIRRDNGSKVKEIRVVPQPVPGLSLYGEHVDVGEIEGMSSAGRYTTIGVSNPRSTAGKAGLKTGDEIVTFDGTPVRSWEQLESLVSTALQKKSGAKFNLGIAPHEAAYWAPETRPQPATKATTEIQLPARPLSELGLYSSELFIATLMNGSPAQEAGLLAGDRLASLNGKPLPSFQDLKDLVQKAGESDGSFDLTVERQGKLVKKTITPTSMAAHDPAGNEIKQYMMGVYPLFVQSEPDTFIERIFNPFTLTVQAWSRALDLSGKTLVSIKKLFFRQVSVGTLGGPILIGKLAGDSMSRGISHFLKVMALISISLAIFNILPVPILDGGHIFLLFVELIRGKPISMRQTEFVQQIGLSIIVLLLVVVLFNDISRVGLPALRQMFQ